MTVRPAQTDPIVATEKTLQDSTDWLNAIFIKMGYLSGFGIPSYDQQVIDESASPNVTIQYKKLGATVATKTIVVVVTTTTISVTVP